ncbi:hypothetical protein ACFSJ3_12970 [Corallincola platygyrae]|uniref:FeoB-associated Cys-rich membrane protein n=1 Tax=Corallincola platygyrae TaxID=1193278 RepID=A0ABW4XP58_9GAMM
MDIATELVTVITIPLLLCIAIALVALAFGKSRVFKNKVWVNDRCVNCKSGLCWSCTREGSKAEQAAYTWSAEPK